MHVVHGRNVNDIWPQLIELIQKKGVRTETRAGVAFVIPEPVATVYEKPVEHVLFDPHRDANPFFSLFEPLWMLAGRDDAQWLDVFIPSFSERFAEEGGRMHGAYGKRWRNWFMQFHTPPVRGAVSGDGWVLDQLDECVRLLKDNPLDRQAVIQMWDPSADLGVPELKDRPCNQQVLLRADREGTEQVWGEAMGASIGYDTVKCRYLDITVTNRSNDLSWGLITANACQFSTLQEYLAARMGYEVGTYTQFSNNLHLYESAMDKVDIESAYRTTRGLFELNDYPGTSPLVDHPDSFDEELQKFLGNPDGDCGDFRNQYFWHTAKPMWHANTLRRNKQWQDAYDTAGLITSPDWRSVTQSWIQRRMK